MIKFILALVFGWLEAGSILEFGLMRSKMKAEERSIRNARWNARLEDWAGWPTTAERRAKLKWPA